ncbi:MAG TPA: hypothetical protein VF607_10450 [Verrucomicrobiae bacterium]
MDQIPLLSVIAKFFCNPQLANICHAKERAAVSETEILVSNRDFELFQAVTLFMTGDLKGCAKKIALAQASGHPRLDPQGDERLTLLRARLANHAGKASEAARYYGILTNSATDVLRAESEAMLKAQPISK